MHSFTLFESELFKSVFKYEYSDKYVMQLNTNSNAIVSTARTVIHYKQWRNTQSTVKVAFKNYRLQKASQGSKCVTVSDA